MKASMIDWYCYRGNKALGFDNSTGEHLVRTDSENSVRVFDTYESAIAFLNE